MMRDRGDDDTLRISQGLLAEMLGVQRPTITNAARDLERAGLITRGDGKSQYLIGRASWRHLVNVISWSEPASLSTFLDQMSVEAIAG